MAMPAEAYRTVTERKIDLAMRFHVTRSGEEVSEAHSPTHLKTTARLTELGGLLYEFSPKELLLAHFAGDFHDLVRSPSEDPSLKNEEVSARQAVRVLLGMSDRGMLATTPEERGAVRIAIENHGNAPEFFLDPEAREQVPTDLNSRLHAALFIADKIEANGARVIARRSSFVAGDRLHNPNGDWQKFGFTPGKDEALVVAIESMLRLSVINPQYIYPERIRRIVDPLYEVQREFVKGVFKAKGLTIPNIADLLLDRKREDGKNMLEARDLSAPGSKADLVRFLEERTGITDQGINDTSEDAMNSAIETVLYFSRDYESDLDELIEAWLPRGQAADKWALEMREYANGNWFMQAREQVSSGIII